MPSTYRCAPPDGPAGIVRTACVDQVWRLLEISNEYRCQGTPVKLTWFEPEGKDMVLVALSGYGQPTDVEEARLAGFNHYLLKPVSVDASNWKAVLVDSGYYKEAQLH